MYGKVPVLVLAVWSSRGFAAPAPADFLSPGADGAKQTQEARRPVVRRTERRAEPRAGDVLLEATAAANAAETRSAVRRAERRAASGANDVPLELAAASEARRSVVRRSERQGRLESASGADEILGGTGIMEQGQEAAISIDAAGHTIQRSHQSVSSDDSKAPLVRRAKSTRMSIDNAGDISELAGDLYQTSVDTTRSSRPLLGRRKPWFTQRSINTHGSGQDKQAGQRVMNYIPAMSLPYQPSAGQAMSEPSRRKGTQNLEDLEDREKDLEERVDGLEEEVKGRNNPELDASSARLTSGSRLRRGMRAVVVEAANEPSVDVEAAQEGRGGARRTRRRKKDAAGQEGQMRVESTAGAVADLGMKAAEAVMSSADDATKMVLAAGIQAKHAAGNFANHLREMVDTWEASSRMQLPGYTSTFSSADGVRGYFFNATKSFTITGLRVPDDDGVGGPQSIQVVRYGRDPKSNTSFTTLAHESASGNDWIAKAIPVIVGEWIGVVGARGGDGADYRVMYADGPFTTEVGTLYRSHANGVDLYGAAIASGGIRPDVAATKIGRVEMQFMASLY